MANLTDNCAERWSFIRSYWNYYELLEFDVIKLQKYIEFAEHNFKTYSNEIARQFLSICSEVDNLCRKICAIPQDQKSDFTKYAKFLLNTKKISFDIRNAEVVIQSHDISLKPFANWSIKNASNLHWWKSYNAIKHNRELNYPYGNFGNLLQSLAALYFLECLAFKIISDKNSSENTTIFDVPPRASKLFYIKNVSTKANVTSDGLYFEV